jgi:8-oxo-dGTP pyrophosphatase MutT (NUDIX family)
LAAHNFDIFINSLEKKLKGPLPGLAAQLKMANLKRLRRGMSMDVPPDVKQGGVLILFYPVDGSANLVFIKRSEYEGVHSGQISFPGGGQERSDSSIIETALREAKEEIGIDPGQVKPIGRITTLYIPPSNFLVTPVVGYTDVTPEFTPEPEEVDHILQVSLEDLLDERNMQEKEITIIDGLVITAPCFYIDGNIIWGATAMILSELLELIRQP